MSTLDKKDIRVTFNYRTYDSIEDASIHLRVPVGMLYAKLERDKKRSEEAKGLVDLDIYIDDEEYIDLDEIDRIQIPHVGDIGDMVDYQIYLAELKQKGRSLEDTLEEEEKEVSEGAVQLDIPFVDTTEEIEEEKESAGSWIKHNI